MREKQNNNFEKIFYSKKLLLIVLRDRIEKKYHI